MSARVPDGAGGRGRRAVVVVLDACGAGALPDADAYGDAGADTLGHLAEVVGGLDLPVLGGLGLGSILPLRGVTPAASPVLHGRLRALGAGKDSATGHWELMGVVAPEPLPTYPQGFPPDLISSAPVNTMLTPVPAAATRAIVLGAGTLSDSLAGSSGWTLAGPAGMSAVRAARSA